jgi:hypothetical protein
VRVWRRRNRRALSSYAEISQRELRERIESESRRVLESNWVEAHAFTMPNRRKYPWQWLWDSCFHAIAWSRLDDPRCASELETVLSLQLPSGFVPHMGYQTDPARALTLWHVAGRSDITQPPMYGHALRVAAERGFSVQHLYGRATAGLDYLFEQRRDPASGLIRVLHPWESGCDDSPRWDGWHTEPFKERRWNTRKRELARSIRLRDAAAWANPDFDVACAGFSALTAFNARELGELTGDGDLLAKASLLAEAIDAHWAKSQDTWSDVCLAGPWRTSAVRTLDGLFPVLVSGSAEHVEAAFAEIFAASSFWRPFGPSCTAADEPSYDPSAYWRGDAWPPEIYLLMIAAQRLGRTAETRELAGKLVRGCVGSGYAERWNPESGSGLGAIPQGWATLAGEGLRVLEGEGVPAF